MSHNGEWDSGANRMKVCLINPPMTVPKSAGIPFAFQPLGLLYIAAVLELNHEVSVVDAIIEGWNTISEKDDTISLGISFEEIKNRLEVINPDVVGISAQFSINEKNALQVAATVKTVNPKIITILGGPHVTVQPQETLSNKHVDFVVVGEGEITIQELMAVLSLEKDTSLHDIRGIGFKQNGASVITAPRPLIEDLDQLPFPARHLVPMDKYFAAMREKRGAREMYTYHDWWTSIITSRGCTYKCNFCSINLSMGRIFRKRSPHNVINEINQVIDEYGIRHINFEDDNLTLDRQRAENIFDLMIENKFQLTWSTPNGVRVENIDEHMVGKMKASGCRRVFVAPESGVQRVVTEIIGKNLDLKKVESAVVLFHSQGIVVDGSFIIGFIGETKKDMWETVRYIIKLRNKGMSEAGLHIATPYFGTRLYEEAVRHGFLIKGFQSSLLFTGEPLIETPEWNGRDLRRILWTARFLLAPTMTRKITYLLASIPFVGDAMRSIWRMITVTWNGIQKGIHFMANIALLLAASLLRAFKTALHVRTKPELIVFEVTDACNSRCTHCYIWKQKPTDAVIKPADLKVMLNDVLFSDLKVVLITGGEPVLRNDIDDLIRSIHETRPMAQISLSTNGLLPDRVISTVLKSLENGIVLNVGISLDAIGDKHDAIRGVKGNFVKVDQLVSELVKIKEKYGPRMGSVVLGHTLSNLTVNSLKEVREYAQKKGVHFVTQLHEKFSYYHNENDQHTDAVNYRLVDNTDMVKEIECQPRTFHNEMLLTALHHDLHYKCASLRTFFLLRCDGSVSPCLHFSTASFGNIKEQTFREIWNNAPESPAWKMVEACRGCSNTWAAEWSMTTWPFSFWRELVALNITALFRKSGNG